MLPDLTISFLIILPFFVKPIENAVEQSFKLNLKKI